MEEIEKTTQQYAKEPISLRQILLSILFILLLIWYVIPFTKSQVGTVQLKNQCFKTFREFSQAVAMMQSKGGNVSDALNNKEQFVRDFSKYFTGAIVCTQTSHLCEPANYHTLEGSKSLSYLNNPNVGKILLMDNSLVMINTFKGKLWISVDLNGIKRKPNRLGVDVFTFFLSPDETSLQLMGAAGTPFVLHPKYCNPYSSESAYNGMSCAYKAILEQDYFNNIKQLMH